MADKIEKRISDQVKAGRVALIVVDVQNDYCHRQGVFGKRGFDLSHVESAVDKLIPFIRHCKDISVPVIFVRTIHSSWTDSETWVDRLEGAGKEMAICRPGTWGSEFYRVTPQANDFIVTKHRFSGFAGTDLDIVLRSKRIETLFMTGVTTNVCVETTARDGFNLDYRIILVEDCCGAFLIDEHTSAVKNIGKYFGVVADSASIMASSQIQ